MSTVGLTNAMREALEHRRKGTWFAVSKATQRRAERAGFIEPRVRGNNGISPRGHAALAAPRMTQAEYDCMCAMEQAEQWSVALWVHDGRWRRPHKRCKEHGWALAGYLTPAGRTALNNVRAAMGSPDWKEDV